MDLTLNKMNFTLNEFNQIEVFLNGALTGKIINIPNSKEHEIQDLYEMYVCIYDCLYIKDISYTDLTKLYDIYSNYEVNYINNTLVIFYQESIVAVLVDVIDFEFIELGNRIKLILYYYTINEFKSYGIDYKELLVFANDIF